jgi:two-component system aerobic respiration control protein ArcA
MQNPHILIVEDESVTRNTLRNLFEAEGYQVSEANDGQEMHQILASSQVQLIIMDINLPGKNGLLLARELKDNLHMGIIFLTGSDKEVDKILGLEYGADDFITKPFHPRELTIRARNLINRISQIPQKKLSASVDKYQFNQWTLDINSRSLITPTNVMHRLPRSEFRAMLHLIENPGRILTRSELLAKMTGRDLKEHDRTVDVTIRRIRKHFENYPETPEIIATIHGEGYRFCGQLETLEA